MRTFAVRALLLASALALACLSFCPAQASTPESRAYIAARYDSASQVDMVRGAIPRWGGPSEPSADKEYAKVVILACIPGAVFLVLTLALWLSYSLAQCCNCCKPAPGGYTNKQLRMPMLAGVLAGVVVVAFSILGLYMTETFHDEMVGQEGVGSITLDALNHTQGLFDRVTNNMAVVGSQAEQLAPRIDAAIDSMTQLGDAFPSILTQLRTMGDEVNRRFNPVTVQQADPGAPDATPNPLTYSASFLSDLPSKVSQLTSDMQQAAGPVLDQVESTKTVAKEKVVDAVPEIQSGVEAARDQVLVINEKVLKYDGDVRDVKKEVDNAEKIRRPIVIAIFAFPLLLVLAYGAFTVWGKSANCTKVLIHLMFFFGFITWIVFLVHVPFALLISDSCHYLDRVQVDLPARVPSISTDVTIPLDACLSQQSLLLAMGIEKDVNFSSAIVFPAAPNTTDLLKVDALEQMSANVQGLSLQSFGFNADAKYTALDALNQLTTPDSYTLDNVASADPNNYARVDDVRRLRNGVLTALDAERALNASMAEVRANMSRVMGDLDSLQTNVQRLLTTDLESLKNVTSPLLTSANNVLADSRCDPLDDDYLRMKTLFCHRMIVSVSSLALASFFASIFLFFVNLACWYLALRLSHPGGVHTLPTVGGVRGADLYGVGSGAAPSASERVVQGAPVQPNFAHAHHLELATQPISPSEFP